MGCHVLVTCSVQVKSHACVSYKLSGNLTFCPVLGILSLGYKVLAAHFCACIATVGGRRYSLNHPHRLSLLKDSDSASLGQRASVDGSPNSDLDTES